MLEEKCEYCTFESDCGKSFMFQLGFPGEEMVICKQHGHYYISCTTNDTGDKINGIQERNSREIACCPICGRSLRTKAWELRIEDSGEISLVWADTAGKAKAQFDSEGVGLRSWFTHDLSEGVYSFTDVSATRLPKLDGMENDKPKSIIKKLVKECGWVSDEINVENVDEILNEREY